MALPRTSCRGPWSTEICLGFGVSYLMVGSQPPPTQLSAALNPLILRKHRLDLMLICNLASRMIICRFPLIQPPKEWMLLPSESPLLPLRCPSHRLIAKPDLPGSPAPGSPAPGRNHTSTSHGPCCGYLIGVWCAEPHTP